jgi:hypothetical protein
MYPHQSVRPACRPTGDSSRGSYSGIERSIRHRRPRIASVGTSYGLTLGSASSSAVLWFALPCCSSLRMHCYFLNVHKLNAATAKQLLIPLQYLPRLQSLPLLGSGKRSNSSNSSKNPNRGNYCGSGSGGHQCHTPPGFVARIPSFFLASYNASRLIFFFLASASTSVLGFASVR